MGLTPRVGLLGGSFDPVHIAHIALAQAARDTLDLARVELIPAGQPWQKERLAAPAAARLAMLELAVARHERLCVNPSEIRRGGPSYTLDTVESLPRGHHYYWLLGADQLVNFCSWHRWERILDYVDLAVAPRPGCDLEIPAALNDHLAAQGRAIAHIPFPETAISATDIRARLRAGRPVDGLLDPDVHRYIVENGLYGTHSPRL